MQKTPYTIVSLKLDFAAQKKGGMAVSAVWTLAYLLAPCPAEPRSTPTHTGDDALCPSPKIQKHAAFGITRPLGSSARIHFLMA